MKFLLSLLFSCSFSILIAQDSQVFTKASEFYIRGNTAVIGNNSLSKDPKNSFNDIDKVNDEFKMEYVDIDNYANTWSSSSAYLQVKPNTQVKYAALYWSGTYRGERSVKRVKEDRVYHKVTQERINDVREIKFKTPYGGYHELQGTLLYDGEKATNKSISSRAPYACMVEVTDLVSNQESGYFTVANVTATQGEIIGGSAAGWMLYVVYEDASEPLQYITTYHGFEFINKQPVTIEFGNFQTPQKGEAETSITIGALEGDSNLGRDQVGIFNPKDKTYVILDNKERASSNFFNSRITVGDSTSSARKPNSLNTLGFDIAKVTIPNTENAIIANSATSVQLQYKTRSDRFFVFFTAFQTTISEQSYNENKITETTFVKTVDPASSITETIIEEQDTVLEKPVVTIVEEAQPLQMNEDPEPKIVQTIVQNDEKLPVSKAIRTTPKKEYVAPRPLNEELAKLLSKKAVSIPEVAPGYYIISNVFSEIVNAEKWAATMRDRDLDAQMFFRQDRKLYYVFLEGSADAVQILEKLNTVKQQKDLKKSWILKVNLN